MTFLKLFLDSADPEKIRRALDFYPLDGVTTNPTILSRQNTELLPLLKELRKITEGKLLFVQVTADKSDDMVCEDAKNRKASRRRHLHKDSRNGGRASRYKNSFA